MIFDGTYMINKFATALRKAFFEVHLPDMDNSVKGSLKYFNSLATNMTLCRLFNGVPSSIVLIREISNAILEVYDSGSMPLYYSFALSTDIQDEVLASRTLHKEHDI